MLDQIEVVTGASAVMQIRSGAPPATCGTANSGTLLASLSLPADWMANAASGAKAKLGAWEVLAASAEGVAAHFRIFDSAVTTCHAQGTVTATGGGGDLTLDNTSIAVGQKITITGFGLTSGNS